MHLQQYRCRARIKSYAIAVLNFVAPLVLLSTFRLTAPTHSLCVIIKFSENTDTHTHTKRRQWMCCELHRIAILNWRMTSLGSAVISRVRNGVAFLWPETGAVVCVFARKWVQNYFPINIHCICHCYRFYTFPLPCTPTHTHTKHSVYLEEYSMQLARSASFFKRHFHC